MPQFYWRLRGKISNGLTFSCSSSVENFADSNAFMDTEKISVRAVTNTVLKIEVFSSQGSLKICCPIFVHEVTEVWNIHHFSIRRKMIGTLNYCNSVEKNRRTIQLVSFQTVKILVSRSSVRFMQGRVSRLKAVKQRYYCSQKFKHLCVRSLRIHRTIPFFFP